MNKINITITIISITCIIIQFIIIIIAIYFNKVDKVVIKSQNKRIDDMLYNSNLDSIRIGELRDRISSLQAELHTIKFPKKEFTHFSIVCKQNNIQWYKEKVKEIFNYIDNSHTGDVISLTLLGELLYNNIGYSNSHLSRIDYYNHIKNKKEFKSCIDKIEIYSNKSILDIIKE